jgi:hypothetical protein
MKRLATALMAVSVLTLAPRMASAQPVAANLKLKCVSESRDGTRFRKQTINNRDLIADCIGNGDVDDYALVLFGSDILVVDRATGATVCEMGQLIGGQSVFTEKENETPTVFTFKLTEIGVATISLRILGELFDPFGSIYVHSVLTIQDIEGQPCSFISYDFNGKIQGATDTDVCIGRLMTGRELPEVDNDV